MYRYHIPIIKYIQVNSALHHFRVAKSSSSFRWGIDGKVTAAGWQVTLCDPIMSRSGVVISTNRYIRFTSLILRIFRLHNTRVPSHLPPLLRQSRSPSWILALNLTFGVKNFNDFPENRLGVDMLVGLYVTCMSCSAM